MQLKVPCCHIIAALTDEGEQPVIQDLVGYCYKVKTFQDAIASLKIPLDITLIPNVSILPAKYLRQAGRSKKGRIKSRGESEPPRRKPYQCGRMEVTMVIIGLLAVYFQD